MPVVAAGTENVRVIAVPADILDWLVIRVKLVQRFCRVLHVPNANLPVIVTAQQVTWLLFAPRDPESNFSQIVPLLLVGDELHVRLHLL